ncbi:MAG: hypothetical protein J6Z34_04550 [Clostridia bacterium]|nr:hypothetical protein [Clostridia bacterium]
MDYGKLALKRIEELYSEIGEISRGASSSSVSVGVKEDNAAAAQSFERSLGFSAVSEGEIKLTVRANVSDDVSAVIGLDGETLISGNYPAGAISVDITCNAVPSGAHRAEITLTGESFSVSGFTLRVSGRISGGTDVFAEAFTDGSGYIVLSSGSLELYSYSGGETSRRGVINGIKYARALVIENKKYVAAVTSTGLACLLGAESSYTFGSVFIPVVFGAEAVTGVPAFDGLGEIFAAAGGRIIHFVLNTADNSLTRCDALTCPASELSAVRLSGKICIVAGSGGYLTLFDGLPSTGYDNADTFNISFIAEE